MAQHIIEVTQKRAAPGHDDAFIDDVGGQFRRGVFECDLDGFDDLAHGFGQRFRDLAFGNDDLFRHAVQQVAALDFHLAAFAVGGRAGGTNFLLDALRRGLADQQVVHAADVIDDRVIHLVAADARGFGIDDATERDNGDFRGAAANIDDHRACRLGHGQARADRGGHGLLDQVHLAGAGALRGFDDGALFHLGSAGRHADNHARADAEAAVMNLADEVFDHRFRYIEIGDDAIAQGADGDDVPRRAAQHLLGFVADLEDGFLAAFHRDRHDGRLIQDDATVTDVNEGIGRTQIDTHIG